MNDKKESSTFDLIAELFAGLICILLFVLIVWSICWGVMKLWDSATYVSPEDKARYERLNKEWETDPRNPKVVGQACLDAGGFPTYSSWDGDLTSCEGKDGKSVNIEVKQ